MSESNDTPQQPYSRNGRRFADRLALTTVVSAGAGALIGGYIGGKHAGRQYLAERAHRLPKTVQGWFFYQKWKNYRSIVGSLKSASKYGLQIGACAFAFVALEEMLDRAAGKVQMGSTVAASLATAVGASVVARLPRSSAKRACMFGLGGGVAMGAAQDFISYKHGHTPAYVLWARQQASTL